MAETTIWHFEDCRVGEGYESGLVEVTEEEIIAYARQFDPQPFHTDPEAARASFFQGLAASGWHTAGLTMRLIVESRVKLAGGAIGMGIEEIKWPRPVRPGDRLRVRCEVVEARVSTSIPGRGIVKFRNTTINQNDEPVQVMTARMLVPRRNSE